MGLSFERPVRFLLALAVAAAVLGLPPAGAEEEDEVYQPPTVAAPPGPVVDALKVTAEASAVVDFKSLARQQALSANPSLPIRTWMPREFEPPPEPVFPAAPTPPYAPKPVLPLAPSPLPGVSFIGLDDIPMADSSYIVIPPDVAGAVGPTRVLCSFNNNYRIQDKATGAVISTVGTATFWAAVVAPAERLSLTDPRTLYDPYNDRWITEMQTVTGGAGKILVGVSQTSDPAGSWNLYSFNTGATIDFPIVGFNKNWISVGINRYSFAGTFQRGINLAVDYPSARAGTGSGTIFTQSANTHFCSGPCVTYSATEETLYVVTHLSSSGATYQVDTITGTAGSPSYSSGGSHTRTGGGWVAAGGNQMPQAAPESGSSACGSTPCKLEAQDAYIRSAPLFRDGYVYYAQTVGLPAGTMTHTAAQWTKITVPAGTYVDGGRVEDATATATNGGKWYGFAHIAVNGAGDFLVGYTQFSSAQHPSAGYSIHEAGDAAGTTRDPEIYHPGEDYYHKTFSTATGRNRWGDFSTAQVDPSDDTTLWTLQEYGKARTGTDDGNTGSNSSRWSTWWAGVPFAVNHTITASAGTGGSINPSGAVPVVDGADQAFTITPDSCYSVAQVVVDGDSLGALTSYTFNAVSSDHTITASFAAATDTVVASAGSGGSVSPAGPIPVACGDSLAVTIAPDSCHTVADVLVDGASVGAVTAYTFSEVTANHTISASFAAVTDTVFASAGVGGSVGPSGAVTVTCGDDQAFTITPDSCYSVAQVVVDGDSLGALTGYTFTGVSANHTLSATFAQNGYTVTASADSGGTITPAGAVNVACGDSLAFAVSPDSCHTVSAVLVDGFSIGPVAGYTFHDVTADHTIQAAFDPVMFTIDASADSGGTISPSGSVPVACGDDAGFTMSPSPGFGVLDVLVDGSSVGSVSSYTFPGVSADHTIAASFHDVQCPAVTVESPNGGETLVVGADTLLTWTAGDNVGVTCVDLLLSRSGAGGPFDTLAACLPDSGSYLWTVTGPTTSDALLKVVAHDGAGNSCEDVSDAAFSVEEAVAVPEIAITSFALPAVNPNPAHGVARISFSVPSESRVRLRVFDALGRVVTTLADRSFAPGRYTVTWNGAGDSGRPASGIYFIQLQAPGTNLVQRVLLIR